MPRPGEVSLAHNGVLFLDEFPEFPRNVLEMLRQPLEDGSVTIARAQHDAVLSLRVSCWSRAMNPCPCGFYGDPTRECRCTPASSSAISARSAARCSTASICTSKCPPCLIKELRGDGWRESSAEMRARVEARSRRAAGTRLLQLAHARRACIRKLCALDEAGERTLEMAVRRMGLSARAHDRILKVARTIADLDESAHVSAKHIAEAVQYRSLDRNYWS